MIKSVFLIIFTICILIGCATIPVPDNDRDTLLIGQIVFYGKGYENSESQQLNGIHKNWLEIIIVDQGTNKEYILSADSNGTFYSVDMMPGEYFIKRFNIKTGSNEFSSSISMNLTIANNFFLSKNKVNNLGIISWGNIYDGRSTHAMNKEYDQVYQFFLSKHPGSEWLKKEWNFISVPASDSQIRKNI